LIGYGSAWTGMSWPIMIFTKQDRLFRRCRLTGFEC
jgi:hypothetical protein